MKIWLIAVPLLIVVGCNRAGSTRSATPPPTRVSTPASSSSPTLAMRNLKQISTGMMMYLGDWDDLYPYPSGIQHMANVLEPYLRDRSLWVIPDNGHTSFTFNRALLGVKSADIEFPAKTPAFYDPLPYRIDGKKQYLVGFADSAVKYVPEDVWLKEHEPLLRYKFKQTAKPLPKLNP